MPEIESRLTSEHIDALARGDQACLAAAEVLKLEAATRVNQVVNMLELSAGRSFAPITQGNQLLDELPPLEQTKVLSHPLMQTWAEDCLEGLQNNLPPEPSDLRRFTAMAAGAAIEQGVAFDSIQVPVDSNRTVMVPFLGRASLLLGNRLPAETATIQHVVQDDISYIRIVSGDLEVETDMLSESGVWLPLRRLRVTPGLPDTITLDDLDPGRGNSIDMRQRLTLDEAAIWGHRLEESYAFVKKHLPPHYADLLRDIRMLVPLQSDRTVSRSVTFGGIQATLPEDPTQFAASLVRGWRQGQARTLHRIRPLHRSPTAEARYYANTEDSPVSFTTMLSLLYSRKAELDLLLAQLDSDPSPADRQRATINYTRLQESFDAMLSRVQDSSYLTPTGIRALHAIANSRHQNTYVQATPEDIKSAKILNLDHELCWRLRNLQPSTESISDLAAQWFKGKSEPDHVTILCEVAPGVVYLDANRRREEYFLQPSGRNKLDPDRPMTSDQALALGSYEHAQENYLRRIKNNVNEKDAWAGLALSSYWMDEGPARRALQSFPEVVRYVYKELREHLDQQHDPMELATWLGKLEDPYIIGY